MKVKTETGFEKLKRLVGEFAHEQPFRLVRISRQLAQELCDMSIEDWENSSFMTFHECEAMKEDFKKLGYKAAHRRSLRLPNGKSLFCVIEVDEGLVDDDVTFTY